MVVFEELGGIPFGISLVKRLVYSVCADIYEWQPSLMNYLLHITRQYLCSITQQLDIA